MDYITRFNEYERDKIYTEKKQTEFHRDSFPLLLLAAASARLEAASNVLEYGVTMLGLRAGSRGGGVTMSGVLSYKAMLGRFRRNEGVTS